MKQVTEQIEQYRLDVENGLRVKILNYGAVLQSIQVPTKNGLVEVLLGYLQPQEYLNDTAYIGAIAGRYCNRIAKGKFTCADQSYRLSLNGGLHHLHGGVKGFSHQYWQVDPSSVKSVSDDKKLTLTLDSADGEEGYPGNAHVQVTYQILDKNKLMIDMLARSDQITPFNLTGHAYFNLNGEQSSACNHHLKVYADRYLPIDPTCIPTGEAATVVNTPFDFRSLSLLKDRINDDNPAIASQKGIDHNFVLNDQTREVSLAAELYSPKTSIGLKVHTTKPGLQVYTGNHLSGKFGSHQGVCLEPQFYPDSPNQRNFPDCFLRPDEMYHHQIIYEFEF